MSEAPSLQDERDIDPELEEALTLRDRLYEARILLRVHGMLTDAESKRADARIHKEFAKHGPGGYREFPS